MAFDIALEKRALSDIQQAIDYYDQQQIGLGKKFLSETEKRFSSINKNPFYRIRYNNVRCLPLR